MNWNVSFRFGAACAIALATVASTRIDVFAGDSGVSGGLTLLEAPSARASSLGEAFSAASDDISAAAYNPAAIMTLASPQASFSYHKGLAEDTFGRLQIGKKGLGFSVGYYSAGDVDLFENGVVRTVNAQTDLSAAFTGGLNFNQVQLGLTLKYLSSQLAESDKATAYAADLGAQYQIGRRVRVGSALQNFGTKLAYVSEGDPLPRIFRAGAAIVALEGGRVPVTVLLDAPYFLNESELRPSVGIEAGVGPLHLRVGYRSGSEIDGLSLGTGISLNNLDVDYAFGFSDQLDSTQRLSFGFRFGPPGTDFAARPAPARPAVPRAAPASIPARNTESQKPGWTTAPAPQPATPPPPMGWEGLANEPAEWAAPTRKPAPVVPPAEPAKKKAEPVKRKTLGGSSGGGWQ